VAENINTLVVLIRSKTSPFPLVTGVVGDGWELPMIGWAAVRGDYSNDSGWKIEKQRAFQVQSLFGDNELQRDDSGRHFCDKNTQQTMKQSKSDLTRM
jgi:hypothetical protein